MSESPDPHADRALVERILDGDVRAFEVLVERQEPRVFRVLAWMGVPYDDREDLAQEVFLRVFRYLPSFKRTASLDSWIYKIAVHAATDERRRRIRRPEPMGGRELEAEAPAVAASDSGLPGRRLLAALGSLTARERAVFVLSELEGIEVKRIAKILKITRVTVRRHLSLARQRLTAELEKK